MDSVTPIRLLCIKEVALLIGSNEKYVYRLVNGRRMPGFKLGGKWVFEESMIKHWIERQMIKNYVAV